MQRRPWPFPPIIILALISIVGIVCVFFYYHPSRESLQAVNSDDFLITAVKYTSGLDGKTINKKADSALQVIGIMIDNHPDSRPASAISQAKIVYEAPVEGGLTRYLAIFDNKQNVTKVGPIRSARAYFLDWLQEYGDSLYMHSGGSPEALNLIKSRKIFDANEFFWGKYYWRSQDRMAPHNLYTNSNNWQNIVSEFANTTSLFTAEKGWTYSRLLGQTIGKKSEIKIPYGVFYTAGWTYDAKNLTYNRTINNIKAVDEDGSQITARNILVQITSVQGIANDDKGRQAIITVGSGDAIILKKGAVIYGTWKKTSLTSRTKFYDKSDREVILVPGNTWVQVVPKETNIQITNEL